MYDLIVKLDCTKLKCVLYIFFIIFFRKMKSFMQNYNDLPALLNNAGVHVTVFLPFDYVMDDIPGSTLSSFSTNPDILYDVRITS